MNSQSDVYKLMLYCAFSVHFHGRLETQRKMCGLNLQSVDITVFVEYRSSGLSFESWRGCFHIHKFEISVFGFSVVYNSGMDSVVRVKRKRKNSVGDAERVVLEIIFGFYIYERESQTAQAGSDFDCGRISEFGVIIDRSWVERRKSPDSEVYLSVDVDIGKMCAVLSPPKGMVGKPHRIFIRKLEISHFRFFTVYFIHFFNFILIVLILHE